MNERDNLTEWFHELADNSHEELLRLASSEAIAKLQAHVARSTPEFPLPDELSPHEFADAVLQFRRNESAWNRATQAALFKADDLHTDGRSAEAAGSLEDFASTCPWALFKEVALNQATHYR